ncbi:MAG: universal stress protein [Bacteroidetes bacterium]|nr:universal stress protein [Bacteroidota bacterium]
MKKILVPTDFSTYSQWALETAVGIAKKTGSEIILLNVIEQPMEGSFNVEGQVIDFADGEGKLYMLQLIKKSKQDLTHAALYAQNLGITVKPELRLGNPFHGIRTTITDHQADLIVIGTAGRTNLEESLIGSIAEKVVRYSRCPVFSVRGKPSSTEFKNIVFASSLDEGEKSFISIVKQMQETYDATLHLVRINTPMDFQPDYVNRQAMELFVEKNKLTNCTINVFSDYEEEAGIVSFATSIHADAIAMATHGRTGFAHLFARSIAEDVVKSSSRPVLTFMVKG